MKIPKMGRGKGWWRAQLFSVGGGQIPHQEEQMKIPKIDEDSQNRWEEGGVGITKVSWMML